MKTRSFIVSLALSAMVLALFGGCGSEPKPTAPVSGSKVVGLPGDGKISQGTQQDMMKQMEESKEKYKNGVSGAGLPGAPPEARGGGPGYGAPK